MAIDLKALKAASEGDQSKKVTVTKAWLAEVHRELVRASLRGKLDNIGDALFGMHKRATDTSAEQAFRGANPGEGAV